VSDRAAIAYYAQHSTTPWNEKLRFALRQAYWSRGRGSPLWALLIASPWPVHPRLLCKTLEAPQRLFYDWRYGYDERVRAICDHYRFVIERWPAGWARPLLQLQPVTVFAYTGKGGQDYALRLRIDHQMEKEGSLTLELVCQAVAVLRCTWHLAEASDGWVLRVGGWQSTNTDTQQQIRQATKDFHGIQPRILMLQALKALGQTLGLGRIEAVPTAWHVYSSRRYRKNIAADYDQLWTFLGFARSPQGAFATDTVLAIKDLEDCPSHKRSEYRRRNDCLLQLQQQLAQIFQEARAAAEGASERGGL